MKISYLVIDDYDLGWCGIYIDNVLKLEGSTIDTWQWLQLCLEPITEAEILWPTEEWNEDAVEVGGVPDTLDGVPILERLDVTSLGT